MNNEIIITGDGVLEQHNKAAAKGAEESRVKSIIKDQYMNRLKARYDAEKTSVENERMWARADTYSADKAMSPAVRKKLVARSRYEADNSAFYAGALESHASAMIGTGPNKRFMLLDDDDSDAARHAFRQHGRKVCFAEKCRQAVISEARDGETILIPFNNGQLDPSGVQLDFKVVDCLQLVAPDNQQLDENNIDGVVLDSKGVPSQYQLLKRHPYGNHYSYSEEHEFYNAGEVVHLFDPKMPGQHRGIPAVTQCLHLFAQFRRYKLAVLTAAETAANVAAMVKLDSAVVAELLQNNPDLADTGLIADPDEVFDLPRGSIPALPLGYDLQQLKAEQPTNTIEMFEKVLLREISRCFGQTYNVFVGDSSSSNMASGSLDERRWWRYIDTKRATFDSKFLDRWTKWWWDEQRRISYSEIKYGSRQIEHPRHTTTWPFRYEHSDPMKETNALVAKHSLGIITDDEIYDMYDIDPGEHREKLRKQVEFRKSLGLAPVGPTVNTTQETDNDETPPSSEPSGDDQ